MAYVQWPATLPGPKYPAGPEWGDSLLLRSEIESGLAQVRRVRTQAVDRLKVAFVLPPPSAYIDFKAFLEAGLKGGALWFQAPWLDGLDLTGIAARFREPLALKRRSATLWIVSLQLEVVDAAGALDVQDWPISNHE